MPKKTHATKAQPSKPAGDHRQTFCLPNSIIAEIDSEIEGMQPRRLSRNDIVLEALLEHFAAKREALAAH